MRNKLEYIQLIDKYLRGVLSKEDTAIFDNRLTTDAQLREEMAKQKLLMEGIKKKRIENKCPKRKEILQKNKSIKSCRDCSGSCCYNSTFGLCIF